MERKRGTTHSERMDRKPNTENENSRTRRRTSSRNRLSAGEDKSRRNTGKSATQGRKNVTYSPIRLLNLFLCPRSKQDSDDVLSKCVIIQGKTIFLLLSKENMKDSKMSTSKKKVNFGLKKTKQNTVSSTCPRDTTVCHRSACPVVKVTISALINCNWIFATGKVVVNVTPGIRYTIRPLKKPMRLWFLELSRRISTTQKDGTLTEMKSASDPSVVPLGVDTETIWYIKPSETKLMGNWSFMHQKTALIPDNIE
ncbi:hypothetical protein MJG53_010059 [Ovis ammon polii x Ovis aries]|uniref:Uncharacterized protein n=1 Tax=Ovis ammon polii x Ovis aries TaxID=2918886 RepID=A0ACB9UWM7_9CETA|nr:hypothetical protein MJG53_010059 [Ovis ammon polii x Ovis aries]